MVVFPEAGGPSRIILGAAQTNRQPERQTNRRDREQADQNHIAKEHTRQRTNIGDETRRKTTNVQLFLS